MREIEKLKGHYIICGYGRTGKVVVEEMMSAQHRFVVIESNRELEMLWNRIG